MKYQIALSPQAQLDIELVFDYIAIDNPIKAQKFINEIINKIETLEIYPNAGKVDTVNNCRVLVKRPYLIYYRVLDNLAKVEIIHIRHGARQMFLGQF